MRIELFKNDPLVVAFEVYDDFFNYKGGIYKHTQIKDRVNFKFDPFELTNHAGKVSYIAISLIYCKNKAIGLVAISYWLA